MSLNRATEILLEEVRKVTNPLMQQKILELIGQGNVTDPCCQSTWAIVQSRLEDEGITVEIVTEH
jgi:hypothetical protein